MPVYTSNPQNVISGGNGGTVVSPPEGAPVGPNSDRLLPPGGATGEVLTKTSNSDFDVDWAAGGGGGGAVTSVNGLTGAVTLTTLQVNSGLNRRYLTDAQLVVIGNTSGTNTGDQTNITGNAATVTTNANLTGPVTSTGNATAIGNGAITNAMLANAAVANLSGTNTGDQTISDATISISDITTNNASISAHGFLKKLSNVANEFMNGVGNWATVTASAAWGGITGTLSSQTDLQNALNLKANLAGPTLTGTVVLPSTTSIGTVSSTEIGYLDGVTSSIQTQLNSISEEEKFYNGFTGAAIKYNALTRSPLNISGTSALVDAQVRYMVIEVKETTTLTGVTWYQTVAGVYTGDNTNGVALYSINMTTGDYTKVAESTNDANIWTGAAGAYYSKAFSSTYVAAPGFYAIALLYNQSAQTTAPSVGTMTTVQGGGVITSGNLRMLATNAGEATFASSVALASMVVSTTTTWAGVY